MTLDEEGEMNKVRREEEEREAEFRFRPMAANGHLLLSIILSPILRGHLTTTLIPNLIPRA